MDTTTAVAQPQLEVGTKAIVVRSDDARQLSIESVCALLAFSGAPDDVIADNLEIFNNQPKKGEVGTVLQIKDDGSVEVEFDRKIGDSSDSDRTNDNSWFLDISHLKVA